jgi:hypothetical protein
MAPKSVLLVNIDLPKKYKSDSSSELFNNVWQGLMSKLRTSSDLNLKVVTTVAEFSDQLIKMQPLVVIYANEAVAVHPSVKKTIKPLLEAGGVAILGGLFSSFTRSDHLDAFFTFLDLPWRAGQYNRTTHQVTEFGKALLPNAPAKFSMKAVQLQGVAGANKLYSPAPDAGIQSMTPWIFEPIDPDNCPVAFKQLGQGAVVYIGDVNGETQIDQLVLTLCNLDWPAISSGGLGLHLFWKRWLINSCLKNTTTPYS